MPDKLTWNEIKERYPDEWVVLVDYSLDEDEDITAGVVLAHGRTKREIHQAMAEPDDAAVLYTGKPMSVAGVMVQFEPDEI